MKITELVIIIFLINGIASAEQISDWPYGKTNIMPDNVSGVMYNFENGGGNLVPFNNTFPEIATFLTVLDGRGYGSDEPAYVWDRGRGMHIYPWDHWINPNGSSVDFIYIVNGHYAFTSRDGPDKLGGYWPGQKAHIEFKEGTNYVSFLASTGGTLYVYLYDNKGNSIHLEGIYANIDRVNDKPSEFTHFSFYSPNKDIVSMKLSGGYNFWLIDDLIIGGGENYIPQSRRNYSYAAERMKELLGLDYLQYGTAWDYIFGDYRTSEEMMDNKPDPYFDFDYKQPELEFGIGINDQDAILYAFNGDGEDLVNWWDTNKMEKQDFTEEITHEEIQPGDVFFIDYPQDFPDGGYGPDGCYDEIGMVIEPTIDDTGDVVDIIRIIPEVGVHYSSSEFINALYGSSGEVDYRHLPDNPKGGHKPYQKIPGTKI